MRYLKGTLDFGLRCAADSEIKLHDYTYSYWEDSVEDKKSTSGCCFSLGSDVILWLSKKQTSISLSEAKATYIATCSTCSEAV